MGVPYVTDRLRLGDHACWIFDDDDRCLREMARFVQAGLARRQRVVYLTASLTPSALQVALQARGVHAAEAAAAGRLAILPARDAYLTDGRFDPARVLRLTQDAVAEAVRDGYAGLRAVSDLSWTLARPPGVDRLVRYEIEANRLFLDGLAVGACLYDRRRFDPDLLRALAAAHPCTNPARADDGWRPPLRIRREPTGLWLRGAADATNRDALAAALGVVVDGAGGPVRVDVSELTFLDAAAAGLLARAAATAPAGLTLVGCSRQVVRTLSLIGARGLPGLTLRPGALA
jgi:anti-anti-sigma regulatory factor